MSFNIHKKRKFIVEAIRNSERGRSYAQEVLETTTTDINQRATVAECDRCAEQLLKDGMIKVIPWGDGAAKKVEDVVSGVMEKSDGKTGEQVHAEIEKRLEESEPTPGKAGKIPVAVSGDDLAASLDRIAATFPNRPIVVILPESLR